MSLKFSVVLRQYRWWDRGFACSRNDKISFVLQESGFFFSYRSALCDPLTICRDIGSGCRLEIFGKVTVRGKCTVLVECQLLKIISSSISVLLYCSTFAKLLANKSILCNCKWEGNLASTLLDAGLLP